MKRLIKYQVSEADIYKTGVYKLFYTQQPEAFYIGSASVSTGRIGKIGFHRRLSGHLQYLRNGRHHSKILQGLFNLHKLDGMVMEIILVCEPCDCKIKEQYFIDILCPPCNTHQFSDSGLGYTHTEESKVKMSKKKKGIPLSDTHKDKISNSTKGKSPKNLSILRSPEIIKKAGIARRGVKKTSKKFFDAIRSPIVQFNMEGEEIKRFISIKEAVYETKIASSSISQCAIGKRKSAGGFSWKYLENGHLISPHIHQKEI